MIFESPLEFSLSCDICVFSIGGGKLRKKSGTFLVVFSYVRDCLEP